MRVCIVNSDGNPINPDLRLDEILDVAADNPTDKDILKYDISRNAWVKAGGGHPIASHSDTVTTGAQLDELVSGDMTTLHSHIGGYVDRGDPSGGDFGLGSLTTDGQWHDLDLSSIVPAGATLVHLTLYIVDNASGSILKFRKKGNSNDKNFLGIRTQVANVYIDGSGMVACDTGRKIQYNATNTTWTSISIIVRGWM